ncbi:unnamed protein product [Rhizophagus irregularis]|nr:unnamed protein product [Rhizophagus irregularis]CAB5378723.1 unnamed protein product [Rhizophagus irregularis]
MIYEDSQPTWSNISDITPFNTTFNDNNSTPQYKAILNMFNFLKFNNNQYNKSQDYSLHLNFTSIQFRNIDKFNVNYYIKDLVPSYFFLYPGQAYVITLYPTVIVDAIVNGNPSSKLELNPQLKQLPVRLKPNEINFGISMYSKFYKREEYKPGYNCNYLQINVLIRL